MGWGAKSRGGGAPRTRVDSRKPLWLPQTPLLPKKSDVRLCPLCPPVSGQRTGSCCKGFWELWSSGFFLWQRWAQRGWDGAECPETRVTPRWVTKQLLRNYLQHGPFFILAAPHACDILVLRPGIEPGPLAVRAQSPYYWTTREFPTWCHFY